MIPGRKVVAFKKGVIVTLLLFMPFAALGQDSNLLDCWQKAVRTDFPFFTELDRFETELLNKGIIQDTSRAGLIKLYDEIQAGDIPPQFTSLSVDHYLEETPLLACLKGRTLNDLSNKTFRYGALLAFYATVSKKHITINLTIDKEGQMSVNDDRVEFSGFRTLLLSKAGHLVEKGVPLDDIILAIRVAPEVKMGLVINLQSEIHGTGIEHIQYLKY